MSSDYVLAPDRPWLHGGTVAWLDQIVQPGWTVLETGCGGSTVWLARRCARVISFEHDGKWAKQVSKELRRHRLLEKVDQRVGNYHVRGLGEIPQVDLALIDGRGRALSIFCALLAVKPGGWLVLDDSSRERYVPAVNEMLRVCGTAKHVWEAGPDQCKAWRKP